MMIKYCLQKEERTVLFNLKCPNCEQQLDAQEEWVGMTLKCPICGNDILVQSPAAPQGVSENPQVSSVLDRINARKNAENNRRQAERKARIRKKLIAFSFVILCVTAAIIVVPRYLDYRKIKNENIINASFDSPANDDYLKAKKHYKSSGVKQDMGIVLGAITDAAVAGNAKAQHWLGFSYANQKYMVKINISKSKKWYEKAIMNFKLDASDGNIEANYYMACCHIKGQGVEKSYSKALEYLQKAASSGHIKAQIRLGMCYEHGLGVNRNHEEANDWYERAKKQLQKKVAYNNKYALYLLSLYRNKFGIDYEKCIDMLQNASGQGHPESQFLLALLYFNDGFKIDIEKQDMESIREWFEKIYEHESKLRFKKRLMKKSNLKQMKPVANQKKIVELVEQSAYQGYAAAQLWLGSIRMSGELGSAESDKAGRAFRGKSKCQIYDFNDEISINWK